jgi:hypothetical protein
MERRAVLTEVVAEALAARGPVMVEVDSDERAWCAVCTAAAGEIELRVGEPHGRRTKPRERWLDDQGFVHVYDAWALPLGGPASSARCAELLDGALEHGLGVDAGAELRRTLARPGRRRARRPPSTSPRCSPR